MILPNSMRLGGMRWPAYLDPEEVISVFSDWRVDVEDDD